MKLTVPDDSKISDGAIFVLPSLSLTRECRQSRPSRELSKVNAEV